MFTQSFRDEISHWRLSATPPEHQLDHRWVQRYRQLASYDSYWWWAQAGPFNEFEPFHLLFRLLRHLDKDMQTAQAKARQAALSLFAYLSWRP